MKATPAPEQLLVICDDEFPLAATSFAPVEAPQAVVVIAPALGVPRRVYFAFCEYLASKGVVAVVFDYRGSGDSVPPAGMEDSVNFATWGRIDIDAMIRAAASLHPGVPIYLVGHSCGGQLVGLARASETLRGVVLVAATLPHISRYPWPRKFSLWVLWYLKIPLFARGPGHEIAQRAGLAQLGAPVRVLRQWAQWARKRDYLFHAKFRLETSRYAKLPLPVLVLGFSDDHQATAPAIDALVQRFESAQVDRRHIDVERLGLGIGSLGHLGFFRSKSRDALWFMVLEWMTHQRV